MPELSTDPRRFSAFLDDLCSLIKSSHSPVTNLKIDNVSISKRLAQLRQCDFPASPFYCREWAQHVYKKEMQQNPSSSEGKAGHWLELCEELPEMKSPLQVVLGEFIQLQAEFEEKGSSSDKSLLDGALEALQIWIDQLCCNFALVKPYRRLLLNPSSNKDPPLTTFNASSNGPSSSTSSTSSSKSTSSSPDDKSISTDMSTLLSALEPDRNGFTLALSEVGKLKALFLRTLINEDGSICQHRSSQDFSPSQLEVEIFRFKDEMKSKKAQDFNNLRNSLQVIWQSSKSWLKQFRQLEAKRMQNFTRDAGQTILAEFMRSQGESVSSFQEYWAPIAEAARKKKQQEIKGLDAAFEAFLKLQDDVSKQFLRSLFKPKLDILTNIASSVYNLSNDYINCSKEAAESSKEIKALQEVIKEITEKFSLIFQRNILSVTDLIAAAQTQLEDDLQQVRRAYIMESRPNVVGRLEKTAQKDFKKMMKRLESGQNSYRQKIVHEMCQVIPLKEWFQLCYSVMNVMLREGQAGENEIVRLHREEIWESANTLENERYKLEEAYREGLRCGRHELGLVCGQLLLIEARKALEAEAAVIKSEQLLNFVHQDEKPKNKKKKKKKVKNDSPLLTPVFPNSTPSIPPPLPPSSVPPSSVPPSSVPHSSVPPSSASSPPSITTSTQPPPAQPHPQSQQQQPSWPTLAKPEQNLGIWAEIPTAIFKVESTTAAPTSSNNGSEAPAPEERSKVPSYSSSVHTSPLSNPVFDTSSMSSALPQSTVTEAQMMASHIQCLESEKQMLQQQLLSLRANSINLQDRFSHLLETSRSMEEIIRSQELRVEQLLQQEVRHERQLGEARVYITRLELRVKELENLLSTEKVFSPVRVISPTTPSIDHNLWMPKQMVPPPNNRWDIPAPHDLLSSNLTIANPNSEDLWNKKTFSSVDPQLPPPPPSAVKEIWNPPQQEYYSQRVVKDIWGIPGPTPPPPALQQQQQQHGRLDVGNEKSSTPGIFSLLESRTEDASLLKMAAAAEEFKSNRQTPIGKDPMGPRAYLSKPPPGFGLAAPSSTPDEESKERESPTPSRVWKRSSLGPKGRGRHTLRCANCGEAGHGSEECGAGCRYCKSLNHQSDDCQEKW